MKKLISLFLIIILCANSICFAEVYNRNSELNKIIKTNYNTTGYTISLISFCLGVSVGYWPIAEHSNDPATKYVFPAITVYQIISSLIEGKKDVGSQVNEMLARGETIGIGDLDYSKSRGFTTKQSDSMDNLMIGMSVFCGVLVLNEAYNNTALEYSGNGVYSQTDKNMMIMGGSTIILGSVYMFITSLFKKRTPLLKTELSIIVNPEYNGIVLSRKF